jgi:hypothetical protein
MAISGVVEPNVTTPAYNPVIFWVDSTNKNETGFKYVVDVYDSTPTKIAEYRVAPEIVNGYGVIDLSKLLQAKVTKDLDLTTTTYYNASNSYFQYSVNFGEEYNASYGYTGFTNSSGYVQLTGFSSHPFAVGDQIDLTETVATNPLLDGLHTVTAIGGTTVTIDVLYADLVSPVSTAGSLIYADNRKSITRDLLIKSNYYVFNGVLPWLDFRTYQDTQFLMTTTGARFLTNVPDNFYLRNDVEAFVNWIPQTTATRRLFFENDNGDTFYKDVTSASGEWVVGASIGTGNLGTLTLVSGTAPLIKSNTEWYEVTLVDGSNNDVSETLKFYIDQTCEIESFDILFMDRLGSFIPFSFTLNAFENGTITKSEYNQDIQGSASGTDWTYNTTDRGMTVLSVDVMKSFTLNTNWMTLQMNQYFEELLTSVETYIKIDGIYQACIIKETSFETVRQRGRKLIRKTITVELANRDSING